jgi:hypothetical protein
MAESAELRSQIDVLKKELKTQQLKNLDLKFKIAKLKGTVSDLQHACMDRQSLPSQPAHGTRLEDDECQERPRKRSRALRTTEADDTSGSRLPDGWVLAEKYIASQRSASQDLLLKHAAKYRNGRSFERSQSSQPAEIRSPGQESSEKRSPELILYTKDNLNEVVSYNILPHLTRLTANPQLLRSHNPDAVCFVIHWESFGVGRKRTVTHAVRITETSDGQAAAVACTKCASKGIPCRMYSSHAESLYVRGSSRDSVWYRIGAYHYRRADSNKCAACYMGNGGSAFNACNASLVASPVEVQPARAPTQPEDIIRTGGAIANKRSLPGGEELAVQRHITDDSSDSGNFSDSSSEA